MNPRALYGLVVLIGVLVAVDGVLIVLAARAGPATWAELVTAGAGGLGLGGLAGYALGRAESEKRPLT